MLFIIKYTVADIKCEHSETNNAKSDFPYLHECTSLLHLCTKQLSLYHHTNSNVLIKVKLHPEELIFIPQNKNKNETLSQEIHVYG